MVFAVSPDFPRLALPLADPVRLAPLDAVTRFESDEHSLSTPEVSADEVEKQNFTVTGCVPALTEPFKVAAVWVIDVAEDVVAVARTALVVKESTAPLTAEPEEGVTMTRK